MRNSKVTGFTIVELLIVIVVIAILAAITIVAYNGIQDRSRESALISDLTTAKKLLLLYHVEKPYPSSGGELAGVGFKLSRPVYDTTANNFYYCRNNVTDEFAIGARTVGGKKSYIISSTGALKSIAAVYADQTCQEVGLTGYTDLNAFMAPAYSSGWQSWAS